MADDLTSEQKKAELANQKKIISLAELQLEVDRVAARDNLSAKKKDQLFQKLLNDNMAGTKAMLSEGGNIGKLTTGMQKAVIDSYRAMGEEVNEGDEKRALQTQKELMEIAFQIKKGKLLEIGETATGLEKLGNSLKLSGLEASNMLSKNWLNFQEKVADAADIKNLGNAISQDFSMLTTEFQGLMALPGMKTIVTGIKFIAAWLGKWLGVRLMAMWKARKATAAIAKAGAGDIGKDVIQTQEDAMWASRDVAKTGVTPAAAPAAGAAATTATATPKTGMRSFRQINRIMKRLTKELKKLSTAMKRFIVTLLTIFAGPAMIAFIKGTKLFKAMSSLYTMTLGKLTTAFKKGAKALWGVIKKMAIAIGTFIKNAYLLLVKGFLWAAKGILKLAKRMMIVIGQFLAAAYTFIAGTLLPAIAAFLFNPITMIVIAIIILLVLIAVGLYFLWDYISSKWETIKVKMKMAGDRLKLVGTKIANWFRDLGKDIGFLIKKMVAKIKDGFVYIVNATIEGFAKMMPDGPLGKRAAKKIRSWKMKGGGAADKVDADWEADIAQRDARDKKLETDFEAKYAERGKELEAAKIKDSERNRKATGGDAPTVVTNTSTNVDQRQRYIAVEGTEVPDSVTLDAIMAHG